MIFERTTIVNAPLDQVFAFFSRPENLARLTPPEVRFEIRESPAGPMEAGSRMVYRIRVAGIPLNWASRITAWDPGRSFVDDQISGPFGKWVHTHTFTARGSSVEMNDRVEYELPFGILGRLAGGWFVRRQLQGIFGYREKKIREIFARDEGETDSE